MNKNLNVSAVQCPKCLDVIFSRARHDFRRCSCGAVGIDGGRDYTKVAYQVKSPTPLRLELVGVSDTDLFNDWNQQADKFGLIKTVKTVYDMLYRYTYNKSGKFYRYEKKA